MEPLSNIPPAEANNAPMQATSSQPWQDDSNFPASEDWAPQLQHFGAVQRGDMMLPALFLTVRGYT